ncbi:hypothetical protein CRV02_13030 [Arcobacter sp. CECT 8989]|uniref:hypothetical protein n=1 Tax=Arcobacter sp. CECT 8989 TaxID=2044509 RepID=UPI00100B7898|nr:hypothetical protein [Arcobacter sp. CECT 8989]RXJ98669.1 hypothetical protein CRV02_13030 [Arcobacter sp. CECT 8989]
MNIKEDENKLLYKEGKVKELDSFYMTANDNTFSFLEDAEYFIFKSFISSKDEMYAEFTSEEFFKELTLEPFLKPIIVTRTLLVTGMMRGTEEFMFSTKEESINDYGRENISEKYDLKELLDNTERLRNILRFIKGQGEPDVSMLRDEFKYKFNKGEEK